MNEEIDEVNSSLREARLENEEEIEFLRSKVVSKVPVKIWFRTKVSMKYDFILSECTISCDSHGFISSSFSQIM